MDKYVLQKKCFSCFKDIGIGWTFCANCGEMVNNTGSKITLSASINDLFDHEDVQTKPTFQSKSSIFNKFTEKVKTTVSHQLDKGDEVLVSNISPFMFILSKNGVETQKIDDIFLSDRKGTIGKDLRGYYYCNIHHPVTINATVLPQGEKHYFVNGDHLKIVDTIYIFSIMNQEKVEWQIVDMTSDLAQELIPEQIDIDEKGNIFVMPTALDQVTINKVSRNEKTRLKPDDLLSYNHRLFLLMEDKLIFQAPLKDSETETIMENVYAQGIDSHLDVHIRERRAGTKLLLSDIQFSVSPGEMVLILGGSGAGKTTLINAIMGSEKADATILLGNKNIYNDFEQVKRMIANVPQFSLHREKDTVYMTIKNAAEMKLIRDFVRDDVLLKEKIDSVLDTVSLSKKRDSLVSELSGGEKKRLSIATEYISDPLVFILDEPDSGVDGSNARSIMSSLRNIANQGKIILVISHNPDRTPSDFDKVVVLAKSEQESCGKLAFYGSVEDTLAFFETDQLELVVAEIERRPDYYINKYADFLSK
ncbi:ABC transporter ATP-binding protein [Streptococcus pneumoniae]